MEKDIKEKAAVVESREWYLTAYAPHGIPTSEHLKLRTIQVRTDMDSIPDGNVLVQALLLSVDPYLRTQMTGNLDGLYLPQIELNQVVKTFGIGRVIRSKDSSFTEGDVVVSPFTACAEYSVTPSAMLRKLDTGTGIPLPEYLSSLGVPGLAAWVGIVLLADPKPGSNVLISAASGGVGMIAGKLAKLRGCRVIGSTGSDEKVKVVKEEFGYDDAFNYNKETDLDSVLTKYFPNGIDIYFDNVGGKMLEAILNHVNQYARIIVCGMVSQYNKTWTEREGVRNLLNIVGKEVRMQGFLLGTYLHRLDDFSREIEGYIKEGKIGSKIQTLHGIESFLEGLQSSFTSSKIGKVIVQVED